MTAPVEIRFLGSGDAFGSGGRFHTCFLVTAGSARFLIDCGASSLIAMRRFGVDPNAVSVILLSHLHGDHFAGVPFFLLDAQFVSRRTRPLVIAGPPGTQKRMTVGREVLFPGSSAAELPFPRPTERGLGIERLPPALELLELRPEGSLLEGKQALGGF